MKFVTLVFISGTLLLFSCNDKESKTSPIEAVNEIPKETQVVIDTSTPQIATSLGEKMFILCDACHSLKKGEPHKTGPNLHNIFGSEAALKEGFAYSDALSSSKIIWDKENMRSWIENPMEFLPNSNMAFVGIKKKEQQDALINYLMEQTK